MKPELEDTLLPAACHLCPRGYDVLELDELWSFVKRRANKRWLWIALCRRTRQVVAYVIGDRGEKSGQTLWAAIPESYKQIHSYSDFWGAYQEVFPIETHRSVGKDPGQTNHVERWNKHASPVVSPLYPQNVVFFKA